MKIDFLTWWQNFETNERNMICSTSLEVWTEMQKQISKLEYTNAQARNSPVCGYCLTSNS